jgi:hypothetical protein
MEVMMAVMLLAVCAMIFAATLPAAHRSRAKADNRNVATSLAQKMLEDIRTIGYVNANPTQLLANGLIDSATPVSTNTYSFTNVDSGVIDSPGSALPSGTGRIVLETLDLELIRITVQVNWSETGQTRTVTIATLLANV